MSENINEQTNNDNQSSDIEIVKLDNQFKFYSHIANQITDAIKEYIKVKHNHDKSGLWLFFGIVALMLFVICFLTGHNTLVQAMDFSPRIYFLQTFQFALIKQLKE